MTPVPAVRWAAWITTGLALAAVLGLHLLPALLAGLTVYELVHLMAPRLQRRVESERGKLVALVLLSAVVVGLFTALGLGVIAFFKSEAGNLPTLMQRMAEIIEQSRGKLPDWLLASLPYDAESLQEALTDWLREHAGDVQLVGREAGRTLIHVLFGMVIGALVSLRGAPNPLRPAGPLARELGERIRLLAEAFRRIVFAQVTISAFNTLFTALYLAVVLPLLGIRLPFVETLIAVTFFAGLLPIIGNLISNTVIVVASLAHSIEVALASLAFLVVIHKLEYFLNARIVGGHINARAWELLLAMLTAEAAFGLGGLVAAPVYYAYLKDELTRAELI